MVSRLVAILRLFFPKFENGMDYGGGYGIFLRIMPDNGFNFFLLDKYAPIFFNKFSSENTDIKEFDILTSFEVCKHLENPILEIEKMLTNSKNICFSTVLIPDNEIVASKNGGIFCLT